MAIWNLISYRASTVWNSSPSNSPEDKKNSKLNQWNSRGNSQHSYHVKLADGAHTSNQNICLHNCWNAWKIQAWEICDKRGRKTLINILNRFRWWIFRLSSAIFRCSACAFKAQQMFTESSSNNIKNRLVQQVSISPALSNLFFR